MLFKKILTLIDGKKNNTYIWNYLLFIRRTFSSDEDIVIPSDKVLQMHSPLVDGELYIDGEVYII